MDRASGALRLIPPSRNPACQVCADLEGRDHGDGRNRPRVHRRRYEEIRDEVLALAQTSGAATTAAILDDLLADDMVAAPTTWSSQWLFTDVIVESGATTCVEGMNAVDYTQGTAGHGVMRDALGDVEPDDAYTSGWIWSYPIRDALRAVVDAGDLTRQGLLDAVTSLESVDYDFMLPPGSGAFGADTPSGQAVRRTVFRLPGMEVRRHGPAAARYRPGAWSASPHRR